MKRLFILAFVILLFSSCRKDELVDPLSSVFEESSGVDVIIVDSIIPNLPGGPNPFVKGYFHIPYELMKDTSNINNVVVYESSIFGVRVISLHAQQRNYFIDINVANNRDYTFSLAIAGKNGGVSKHTEPFFVHIP